MNIYIHVKSKNPDLERQAELLANELETLYYHVEWSNKTHPLRFLLNKYDIVHLLTDKMPLTIFEQLLLITAHSLQIPTVISNYGFFEQGPLSKRLLHQQFRYTHSLSVASINEMKQLRNFRGNKWLLPALNSQSKHYENAIEKFSQKISDLNFILPVINSFSDLPSINFPCDTSWIIDATMMKNKTPLRQIRNEWSNFIQKNPTYKNAILVLENENIETQLNEHQSAFFISHLKLNAFSLNEYIDLCRKTQSLPILNDHQATGFSDLWQHEKNCLLFNLKGTRFQQLEYSELIVQIQAWHQLIEKNPHQLDHFLCYPSENKINELSREYAKIKNQKEMKITYAHLSDRP